MAFYIRKSPPILNPGTYPATVADLKQTEGKYGPNAVWTLDVLHEGHTYRAQAYTDVTFYEGSREHRWASAILDMDLKAEESFDETEVIGALVQAKISVKTGNDGKAYYRAEDLFVLKPGQDGELSKPAPEEGDVPF